MAQTMTQWLEAQPYHTLADNLSTHIPDNISIKLLIWAAAELLLVSTPLQVPAALFAAELNLALATLHPIILQCQKELQITQGTYVSN